MDEGRELIMAESEDTRVPQSWEILNSTPGGEVIDTRCVAQRIEDLINEHMAQDADGDWVNIPTDQWPADQRAEHDALTALLAEVAANLENGWDLSANGDSVTLVHPDYLTDYVREWYGDTYGGDLATTDRWGHAIKLTWSDVMDREPFCWINWGDVADRWRERCAMVEYHGVEYLLDH